jgi:hypothetical protein
MRLVSIDAIATNPTVATAIRDAWADYLLAVKSNQPTLRVEIESLFNDADPADLDTTTDFDRAMAASSNEPSRSPARSIGSTATGVSPAKSGCTTSPPS